MIIRIPTSGDAPQCNPWRWSRPMQPGVNNGNHTECGTGAPDGDAFQSQYAGARHSAGNRCRVVLHRAFRMEADRLLAATPQRHKWPQPNRHGAPSARCLTLVNIQRHPPGLPHLAAPPSPVRNSSDGTRLRTASNGIRPGNPHAHQTTCGRRMQHSERAKTRHQTMTLRLTSGTDTNRAQRLLRLSDCLVQLPKTPGPFRR